MFKGFEVGTEVRTVVNGTRAWIAARTTCNTPGQYRYRLTFSMGGMVPTVAIPDCWVGQDAIQLPIWAR
jgi:hypothetical protein